MDWTDRHCRMFHRQLSKKALLYTEMITAHSIFYGDAEKLLHYSPDEHPLALQIGGSDPALLAQATKAGVECGYDEINLNVGCPSDRVQSGAFGAVLMKSPELVAECVSAMREVAGGVPVTVKCRIGVDEQDPKHHLPMFLKYVIDAGVTQITIHARMAWLKGLSPKENRDIPPLDYPLIYQIVRDFPDTDFALNGGVASLKEAQEHFEHGVKGVMIGRAAYHTPYDILSKIDYHFYNSPSIPSPFEALRGFFDYIENELLKGVRLHQMTRHMLGLFSGRRGARGWRRHLSHYANQPHAGIEVIEAALHHIDEQSL